MNGSLAETFPASESEAVLPLTPLSAAVFLRCDEDGLASEDLLAASDRRLPPSDGEPRSLSFDGGMEKEYVCV